MNLERMGLFRGKGAAGWSNANWQALKRGLQLTVDGVSLEEPTDIAYVTAGCVVCRGCFVTFCV
jgi:hypothetical protein